MQQDIITKPVPCSILSSASKPYSFEGKTGISYKAQILIGEKVFAVKMTKEVYEDIKDLKSQEGEAVFKFNYFKDLWNPKLESFTWK